MTFVAVGDTDPTSRERADTAGIEPGTRSRALSRLSYLHPPPSLIELADTMAVSFFVYDVETSCQI